MRFSPYKETPFDELEVDRSPFVSSPLKSMIESTPSKVNYPRKYSSVFTTPKKETLEEIDFSDLLTDLDIKERLNLISQDRRKSINFSIKINSNVDTITKKESTNIINEEDILKQLEDSVINEYESRIDKRSQSVKETIAYIKNEKERIERDRIEKEKKEADLKRLKLEEEKKKQEAEKERLRLLEIQKQQELEEKKQAEIKKKQEEEGKKLEEAKKLEEESKKNSKGVTNFNQISKKFHTYKSKIIEIKESIIKPINSDKNLKSLISQHKRKINPKFGQLTNSLTQLNKITNELVLLINQSKQDQLAFKWILNFVSKAIVSQAETEVRAKPSSSVPLAKLTLNLLCEFPEMKEYLMARFIKKCPYIIGHTRHLTKDDATFVEMGWRKQHDDNWETQISYDERMAGIITLFFVITRLQLDQKYYSNMKHPLNLSNAWIFISRMLNTPKESLTSTHYTIVTAWWESCGKEVLLNYGKQGYKILRLASNEWCDLVADNTSDYPGANMLRTKGEDWEKDGVIKSFPEMEP